VLPPFKGAAEYPHIKTSPSLIRLRNITRKRLAVSNMPNMQPTELPTGMATTVQWHSMADQAAKMLGDDTQAFR
jgi:hypothetical protein